MQVTALRRPVHLLAATARDLLGPGVTVAGGHVAEWTEDLWSEEAPAVARAVPLRRREFAAGRAAARHAMAELGRLPVPLPRSPDGPPCWPQGLTGSISHAAGYVLAAVGPLGWSLHGLGIDIEQGSPLAPDLAAEICRPDEDASQAIQVFSAKEAAYKAQFTLTGRLLSHADLRVRLGPSGEFEAEFMSVAGCIPRGARLVGRQARVGPLLLSTVRIGGMGRHGEKKQSSKRGRLASLPA